jgi:V/A-type H+-transporting ATPase subunit A
MVETSTERKERGVAHTGTVVRISGPLVVARALVGAKMYEMVRVGEERLFGEIVEIHRDLYSIQVYEPTEGLQPGDPVEATGMPLSVELGPGLIGRIFDGVQRPLEDLLSTQGVYVRRGAALPALPRDRRWAFRPGARVGGTYQGGDILGVVQESHVVEHRVLVPPGVEGELLELKEGEFTVEESIGRLRTKAGEVSLQLMHRWPVRRPRPVVRRVAPAEMLVTGQRVVDMLFPIAKGGTACIPGPFGSGKTVMQHQFAKWADADIVVYVGCGERGNEMTDVLMEFPRLKDPRTGRSLMERTVLVANTSNMPVAAREASVFTGITLAEYYRDQGYDVALMADSTSRWAEAMREISGRLEEMPGEEGFPAYLASRIAGFYERAGRVIAIGGDGREGTLSLIGAVSPPGGDFSEPVVQATLRVVKVFWGLDDLLAAQRHFPAINWLTSYSLYQSVGDEFAGKAVSPDWPSYRVEASTLLAREAELEELVRLVGVETLPPLERLVLQAARMVREDFLHQNANIPADTYTSLKKQFLILKLIVDFYRQARPVVEAGADLARIAGLRVLEEIARAKYIPEDQSERFQSIARHVTEQLLALRPEEAPSLSAPGGEAKQGSASLVEVEREEEPGEPGA